jgi:nitrite reductase/ring-hydroxylating ferredoxin subunit
VTAPTSTATQANLGPVDQIPLGEGRAFGVGSEQVAVFRLRDGTIHALSAVCPHRGGPIADGQIDGRIVLCPLHLNAFELDSGCSLTGQPPLRSYPVHLDAGQNIVLVNPYAGSGHVTT